MIAIERWIDRAQCAGSDPGIWFPDHWNADNLRLPRQTCAACPVRRQCLGWALEHFIDHGMWGGLTPEERQRIRRRTRMRKPRSVRDLMPHGTRAAIKRHERAHEPLCSDCRPLKRILDEARGKARTARRRAMKASA